MAEMDADDASLSVEEQEKALWQDMERKIALMNLYDTGNFSW